MLKGMFPITETSPNQQIVGAVREWLSLSNAIESKPGYLLSGPAPPTTVQFLTSTNSVMMLMTGPSEFTLERFWDLESVGVTCTNDNPPLALEHYLASCVT